MKNVIGDELEPAQAELMECYGMLARVLADRRERPGPLRGTQRPESSRGPVAGGQRPGHRSGAGLPPGGLSSHGFGTDKRRS